MDGRKRDAPAENTIALLQSVMKAQSIDGGDSVLIGGLAGELVRDQKERT